MKIAPETSVVEGELVVDIVHLFCSVDSVSTDCKTIYKALKDPYKALKGLIRPLWTLKGHIRPLRAL